MPFFVVREFRVERLQELCDRVLVFDDQEEDSLLTLLALYRFIAPQLFQQYRSSPERVRRNTVDAISHCYVEIIQGNMSCFTYVHILETFLIRL